MKLKLISLFRTKLGWMYISMFLLVVFTCLSTHSGFIDGYEFFDYALLAPLGYLVGLALIMIVYAWIINPIRERREMKKEREANKGK